MNHTCDQLAAFVDGELAAPEAAAFRDHLADCSRCQQGLHESLQLAALAAEARLTAPKRAVKNAEQRATVLGLPRRVYRTLKVAGPTLVAAAALALWVRSRDDLASSDKTPPTASIDTAQTQGSQVAIALAPTRAFEGRLSSAKLDSHRPYRVNRAGSETQQENVDLQTLAAFEKSGDRSSLAGAYILMGAKPQALALLEKLELSPQRLVDESALALQAGDYERALKLATQALDRSADFTAAWWNRALALRGMGLLQLSAQAFDEVAKRNENGWSQEARQHAQQAQEKSKHLSESWLAAYRVGNAMMGGGPIFADAVLTAHPAMARLYFYHALRAADTAERAQQLRPLAEKLDALASTSSLVQATDHVLSADFSQRARFAQAYRNHVTGQHALTGKELADFIRDLDRAVKVAHVEDIRLGIALMTSWAVSAPEAVAKLIEQAKDPWFDDLIAKNRASHLRSNGKFVEAEKTLRQALATCEVDYRCMQLEDDLFSVMWRVVDRPVEHRKVLRSVLTRARRLGEWSFERQALRLLGEVLTRSDEHEVGQAYLNEVLLLNPSEPSADRRCGEATYVRTMLVSSQIAQLRFDQALATLRAVPRCGPPREVQDILVVIELARFGLSVAEVEQAAKDLEDFDHQRLPKEALEAAKDYLKARILALRDPAGARAIYQARIGQLRGKKLVDALEKEAWGYLHLGLAGLDASEGKYEQTLATLADEVGLDVPRACAFGIGTVDELVFAVAKGVSGEVVGQVVRRRSVEQDVLKDMLPSIVEHVKQCPSVAVLAHAPFHGTPLLPSDMAWSYVGATRSTKPMPVDKARRVVIADPNPPAELELAPLTPWRDDPGAPADVVLRGPAATPEQALAALKGATEVEFHAHGQANTKYSDSSLLLLSPSRDGNFALSAETIESTELHGQPVVFLVACETSGAAPQQHVTWSLPIAFLAAGAKAVIASRDKLPDDSAQDFFDAVRRRIAQGAPIAQALRDERVAWLQRSGHDWVKNIIVFESSSPVVK